MAAKDRQEIRNEISKILLQIDELEKLITDFDGNNDVLHTKLNEYIASLKDLSDMRHKLEVSGQPIEIPMELLTHLDDGGNPDSFIIDLFTACRSNNQIAKGKVESFKQLRSKLVDTVPEAAAYEHWKQQRKSAS